MTLQLRPDARDPQRRCKAGPVPRMAAARRLGVSQPRLNDLLRNRINNKFSLDALVTLACRAGLTVKLDVAAPAAA